MEPWESCWELGWSHTRDVGFGSRWGWIHIPTTSLLCGTSGGVQGVPPPLVTAVPCLPVPGRVASWPCGLSLTDQTPSLCNVPNPPGKGQNAASLPWGIPSGTRGDQGGVTVGPGWRRGLTGTCLQCQEHQRTSSERENLEGPSGTKPQAQGRCCHTEPAETPSEDRSTPGRPLPPLSPGGSSRGHRRHRGWGRPGQTCSPALCCMTVIKLLPFVMVPRGGFNQLLIKTDGSEVASPESLDPWNFGKSHRGARSHRAEPRTRGRRGDKSAPWGRQGGHWGASGEARRMPRAGAAPGREKGDPKGCGGRESSGKRRNPAATAH